MIASRFMEVARRKLDAETFACIYTRAVELERQAIEDAPAFPVVERIDKPEVAAKLEAHLNNLPAPHIEHHEAHVQQRLETRMDIEVGPNDLSELEMLVRTGGPNVKIFKREMQCNWHCEVDWRGKHFIVVFNQSRNRLITAYPKVKKHRRKARFGKPTYDRSRLRQDIEIEMEDAAE